MSIGIPETPAMSPLEGEQLSNFENAGIQQTIGVNADWAAFAMGVLIVFREPLASSFVIFLTSAGF
jgi:hypothetical protein